MSDTTVSPMNRQLLILVFCKRKIALICLAAARSLQSCPTLCDPVDCSLRGSSVHGILQAKILEWVAVPSFRGSSQLADQNRSPALEADSLPLSHQGSPIETV